MYAEVQHRQGTSEAPPSFWVHVYIRICIYIYICKYIYIYIYVNIYNQWRRGTGEAPPSPCAAARLRTQVCSVWGETHNTMQCNTHHFLTRYTRPSHTLLTEGVPTIYTHSLTPYTRQDRYDTMHWHTTDFLTPYTHLLLLCILKNFSHPTHIYIRHSDTLHVSAYDFFTL